MNSPNSAYNDFLKKLTEVIETNLTNPQFGVSMLAREMGMSRSTLHRKVNAELKISVSQFINQVRLKKAKYILRHTPNPVSEVACEVGFNNVSYFTRCFHAYYGYSPKEVGLRENDTDNTVTMVSGNKKQRVITGIVIFVILFIVVVFIVFRPFAGKQNNFEKTVLILLPINNSPDSTHVIDGVIYSVYSKLSLIKDMSVLPVTSVIKYRKENKTIPEIARESGAKYIIESSGLFEDSKIRINVSLINTSNSDHIWSKQYTESGEDIFILEDKLSKQIAEEINARITPEEQERINKRPTKNRIAYDYYQKGLELYQNLRNTPDEEQNYYRVIDYYEKAIKQDSEFALVFAELTRVYNDLDLMPNGKTFPEQIKENAKKAIYYDPEHEMSNVAQAIYYRNVRDFEWAIKYLEKALQYNPNSYTALNNLRDVFGMYSFADTEQHLKYSLLAKNLINLISDSSEISLIYQRVAGGFRTTGFFSESEKYFNKALEFDPANSYAASRKVLLYQAMEKTFQEQIEEIMPAYLKDSSNFYILRSLFLVYFENSLYKKALILHNKLLGKTDFGNKRDAGKVGFIFSEMDQKESANKYFEFALSNDAEIETFYKHYYLSATYAAMKDSINCLKHMKEFSKHNNFYYWTLRAYKKSPIFKSVRELSEYQQLLADIETTFWQDHKRIKKSLEEKGLMDLK